MGKILIIDDERSIRRALREIFEFENFEVEEAENGKEGVDKVLSTHFDIIFCDIKMPVMDGLNFLRIARERGHEQPIIFFTGHGTEQLKREVRELGAADLLMKPNFLMLELAIRKHMIPTDPY